jgi:hypothetical protein
MRRPQIPASIRNLGWRVAPGEMAERNVRYQRRRDREHGRERDGQQFASLYGDRVLRGPMKGASYHPDGNEADLKLAGAYELEIQPWLEEALQHRPRVFLDVGAADGYYAVGVAATAGIRTVAYELAKSQRERLTSLARATNVRVEVRGMATSEALSDEELDGALVLVDVEGAEGDILSEVAVRHLSTATVIVELHERSRPGVTELLRQRFDRTHSVSYSEIGSRDASDFPEMIQAFGEDKARSLVSEAGRTDGHRFMRCVPQVRSADTTV